MGGKQDHGAAAEPWSREEIAWARECFTAGDSLAEIADTSDRGVLDVARALGVYHARPMSLRWRQSARTGGYIASPWIGGLLKEVAVARCKAGDCPDALAAEAGVAYSRMAYVLKGVMKRRRRREAARHELSEAA